LSIVLHLTVVKKLVLSVPPLPRQTSAFNDDVPARKLLHVSAPRLSRLRPPYFLTVGEVNAPLLRASCNDGSNVSQGTTTPASFVNALDLVSGGKAEPRSQSDERQSFIWYNPRCGRAFGL
jgi:hypothetical protein